MTRRSLQTMETEGLLEDEVEVDNTRIRTVVTGDRLTTKLLALVWVFVAYVTARWTHVYQVIIFGGDLHNANRPLLHVVAAGVGIQVVLAVYLLLYLPIFQKLNDSSVWPVYCPRVIPTATVTGIVTIILLIRAVWPVYGFLAPLVLGTQAMGWIFATTLIPWPF